MIKQIQNLFSGKTETEKILEDDRYVRMFQREYEKLYIQIFDKLYEDMFASIQEVENDLIAGVNMREIKDSDFTVLEIKKDFVNKVYEKIRHQFAKSFSEAREEFYRIYEK